VGGDAALALATPDAPPGGGGGQGRVPAPRYTAAWAREEALGAAGPPLFLDLPAPSAARLAARRAAAPRLGERLHAEWLAVKVRARRGGPRGRDEGQGHTCARRSMPGPGASRQWAGLMRAQTPRAGAWPEARLPPLTRVPTRGCLPDAGRRLMALLGAGRLRCCASARPARATGARPAAARQPVGYGGGVC